MKKTLDLQVTLIKILRVRNNEGFIILYFLSSHFIKFLPGENSLEISYIIYDLACVCFIFVNNVTHLR